MIVHTIVAIIMEKATTIEIIILIKIKNAYQNQILFATTIEITSTSEIIHFNSGKECIFKSNIGLNHS